MLVWVSLFLLVFTLRPHSAAQQTTAVQEKGMEESMQEQIMNFLANAEALKGAQAAIAINDANTGEMLFQYQSELRMRPASNQKLLTAAAALAVFGENHRFHTKVMGSQQGHAILGDIYLKGMGDPSLLYSDLEQFAADLAARGIRRVNGNVAADDSYFDDERYSEDLTWKDEYAYYGSAISALTISPNKDYDTGTVMLDIKAEKTGEAPSVAILPETAYVEIDNQAVTADAGEEDLTISREHGENIIHISGTIPKNNTKREWIAVWDPTLYTASLFKQALEDAGIQVEGKVIRTETPSEKPVLLSKASAPLKELLNPFMKLSNNGHGEMLVKHMGKRVQGEGSWEKGLEVLTTELKHFGLDTNTIMLRDGSGISHVNGISAQELIQLLLAVQKESWFPSYLEALPLAGEEERRLGGTLRNRMTDSLLTGNVRAKTGTITGVSTLSGYVKTSSNREVVFSILFNGMIDEEEGPDLQDDLLKLIAESL